VLRLDLEKLLSSEAGSPVTLKDEAVNPKVEPNDALNFYEKPDYRTHRTVRVRGQVVRPGFYVLDQDKPTLSQVIQKAGGLTSEAMPRAGLLLRTFDSGSDPASRSINDIMGRLNETTKLIEKTPGTSESIKGTLFRPPVLHGLSETKLTRMVVDFEGALRGDKDLDAEILDGDEIIIPRQMDIANVVGETSSPFGSYKVKPGMKVADLLSLAGGTTRNADTWNIRLVKADGRIVDSWVKGRAVEPGDTLIVPQRIRRESNWQENLTALTSVGLILNALATAGHL
jgi:protein involved in polysaccharide export with SLBB domain